MYTNDEDQAFNNLPTFDARKFEPPAWANNPEFQWSQTKNGESSKSSFNSSAQPPNDGRDHTNNTNDHDEEVEDEEEEEEVWEDARSVVEPEEARFTIPELRELLARANKFKAEGNNYFMSKPPKYDLAAQSYESAIDHLPSFPKAEEEKEKVEKQKKVDKEKSGIEEITDEEAAAIQVEAENDGEKELTPEEREKEEREGVESEIRELSKACWGNLAACHIALKDDKKAVKACDSALEVDPLYTKALHRRATANERIGSATALSSAQEDYKILLSLLPSSSPQLPTIKRSLSTLPSRLQDQQQKEMTEALGQLKELGNKFLGTFGLNTDMFKMDKAADGSYSMKFGN